MPILKNFMVLKCVSYNSPILYPLIPIKWPSPYFKQTKFMLVQTINSTTKRSDGTPIKMITTNKITQFIRLIRCTQFPTLKTSYKQRIMMNFPDESLNPKIISIFSLKINDIF
ncbi:hypothetical protein BGP_2628 [Beggiatoa sp. PS]|nr:hypothetical protein BGP_2628 [Beggiatoa sp. PS]